jgi:hypothetical protein
MVYEKITLARNVQVAQFVRRGHSECWPFESDPSDRYLQCLSATIELHDHICHVAHMCEDQSLMFQALFIGSPLFVIVFAIHISELEKKWEFSDKTVRCSESNLPANSSRLTYHTASIVLFIGCIPNQGHR